MPFVFGFLKGFASFAWAADWLYWLERNDSFLIELEPGGERAGKGAWSWSNWRTR